MVRIGNESWPEIAIATTDGKAYYYFTFLLRASNIPFISITPDRSVPRSVKLILTTRKEKPSLGQENVLCYEEMGPTPLSSKEKILSRLYGLGTHPLLVGVDPGGRMGWVAYYRDMEVAGGVINSTDRLVETLTGLMKNSLAVKKIVRIGDGNMAKALEIASRLSAELGGEVEIEIVDERGTSSSRVVHGKKGLRDQASARLISMRAGQPFVPRRGFVRYTKRRSDVKPSR